MHLPAQVSIIIFNVEILYAGEEEDIEVLSFSQSFQLIRVS